MKKAILMAILSALILSSCGKVEEPTNDSRVTESASVTTSSAITEATSTEITDETTITTTTSSEEKKSTTTLITTESKSKTSTAAKKTTVQATQRNGGNTTRQNTTVENGNQGQNYQPEQTNPPQNNTVTYTTTAQQIVKTTTTQKPRPASTTAKPKPVVTTTTTKKQEEKAEWSNLMKAWKKLAIGQGLSSNEENLIRTDIIEYGLDKFNGKQTVTCTCGNDVETLTFMSPLKMTANYSWNDFSHANMDACSNAESSALIKVASGDKEVYNIVKEARNDCLSVIDNGVSSWHYFYDTNNCLKYASDLEFSVYIDGTYVWFLTE